MIEIEMDELGRFWLCGERGPFSGPYDTEDKAQAVADRLEANEDED